MNIQMIPLNRLTPSPANVRKTGMGIGIDELAASIAAHGLLQNLQVRPGKGGKFEVVAGGRRLAALKLLAKQKALSKLAEIGCNVLDDGEDPVEIGLAENIIRLAMHPADQFDAFKAMADQGKGPEEIAARFGCTPAVVRQRLKLATVSPRLMDIYRAGEMNLDQLMAFTVSDDHAAQEAAWFDQPSHSPSGIRRALTITQVEADDALALFVGVEAYAAAGGPINRDLFQPEHEGYLTDPALLDRLAVAKLNTEAEAIRAEGWAWVEAMLHCDYATLRSYGRVAPEQQPLTDEQAQELDRFSGEYDALHAEHGDDPEPEIWRQLEDLSDRIDALSSGNVVWTPEIMARSGVIVSIASDGALDIERGLIRPEDRAKTPAPASDEDGEGDAPSPVPSGLSDRLTEDLTAHRTAALRIMLADNPALALVSVVHALALPLFYGSSAYRTGSSLDLRITSADLASSADGIADSAAGRAMDERHAAWRSRMPEDADAFWGWLLTQSTDRLMGLLAVCAGMSVNAVHKRQDRADAPRLAHADQLADALGLDMTQWWQPTAAGFFGRIAKSRILEAVAEGFSKGAADNLAKLKKDVLAQRAEAKLGGTGWLPAVLRSPEPPAPAIAEAA
jgi:ParB family chromosome partitioning protein